ncbi:aldo/keto reductase [Actimicrobium sp. CCC2.4]|uniref:aldo/keto reductase n=1 Tax=Actimicrobium sp. CCC2.4 TaxID=3048606 RepID=UPI002AC89609|nr:aldo/keto reductase [Actimicrobium sp. CCC2.4]MEB0137193.1 aldo/keto reductase [Actimicrobium sp. CCC2.4]WPX32490.1 aldo/keto reductase [Actimicrobium sp. CCC2.4]
MLAPRIVLAPDGPELSRIVLGLWRLGEWQLTPAQRLALVEQAVALGITTMDQADIYGGYTSEALFGEALALAAGLRQRLQIVSKCGIRLVHPNRPSHTIKHYDTGRAHLIASVEQSLNNLGTDYLDLLLIHRPDPLMEADEVAEAFGCLQRAGKVRYFGASNFTPAQFELLASRHALVTNQIELSVLHVPALDDGTLDQAQRLRCAPMIWSALAGGRLFGAADAQGLRVRAVLARIAETHAVTPAVIATAWVLRHPSRPLVLTGSGRIAAITEAVAATQLVLTREEWFAILAASTGGEVA